MVDGEKKDPSRDPKEGEGKTKSLGQDVGPPEERVEDEVGVTRAKQRSARSSFQATLRRMAFGRRLSTFGYMTATLLLTVYHDGSCPLCRLEIGHYRRQRGAERIDFVDVADPTCDPGPWLSRQQALKRFHARLPGGELKSGAPAFIEIWKVLPRWRPAASVVSLPGVTGAMQIGYRLFSPMRPVLAKAIGRFT